jgi:biotin carboxylase
LHQRKSLPLVTWLARPVLAIVFGDQSASAMALSEAASSLCDIVWVVNSDEMAEQMSIRLLNKLGKVVDIAGMALSEASELLGAEHPHGIVAYADAHIGTASALGAALGLDYFNSEVAARLLDKVTQRRALHDAALPVPACVAVSPPLAPRELEELISTTVFPVVLKPRRGAASRETYYISDAAQLRAILTEVLDSSPRPDMVIEEYLVGASPSPSEYFGDFVSVESVVSRGNISHLAITGRLPWAKPFRETGLTIPSDYEPSLVTEIFALVTKAIAALDIQSGCLHTEIKVTDEGPRIIEVNGRIGGFVAPVLALASPGLNFYEISQRVAFGEEVVFEEPVPTHGVGFVIVGQPPIGARRVLKVSGLDRLAAYPGVSSVSLNRSPGDEVNWRLGSHEFVYSVLGNAPDHASVRAVQEYIDEFVVIDYEQ